MPVGRSPWNARGRRRKAGAVFIAGKLIFTVSAEKSEGMLFGQFVPKMFQFDCAVAVSFVPKNCDHFSKSANTVALPGGGFDQRANERVETESLGLALMHKQSERFGSVKR